MIYGLNSSDNNEHKYTLKNLNIKAGSKEASIFKQIDLEDGIDHGYLNQDQYKKFFNERTKLSQSNNKSLEDIQKNYNRFEKEIANEYDDFNKGITEDSKEFKKNNINEILECLSKGYNGCLVLETYGRISYDKDIQKFIFTKESTGQQVELDDEKLNKVIQLAIEHNINHYGEARKTINK